MRALHVAVILLALNTGLAEAQKSCKKGIPCGGSCIRATKTCHVGEVRSGATTHATERPRDEHGRFIRSSSAKARFMCLTNHPGGWSGHVVDHIIPLACGGSDSPENMQ